MFAAIIPILVFAVIVIVIWSVLSRISNRNSKALDRLQRLSRPPSLTDLEDPKQKLRGDRVKGLLDAAKAISSPLMPQTELEQSNLKQKLANAGFRSDAAPMVYSGVRFACLLVFFLGSAVLFLPMGFGWKSFQWIGLFTGIGFYLPSIILWWL